MSYWVNHYSSLLPGQNLERGTDLSRQSQRVCGEPIAGERPIYRDDGRHRHCHDAVGVRRGRAALVPSVANGGEFWARHGHKWPLTTRAGSAGRRASATNARAATKRCSGWMSSRPSTPTTTISTKTTACSCVRRLPSRPARPFDRLKLRIKYDDGFVAYLNGVKVAESNAPAGPAWNSEATAAHDERPP